MAMCHLVFELFSARTIDIGFFFLRPIAPRSIGPD